VPEVFAIESCVVVALCIYTWRRKMTLSSIYSCNLCNCNVRIPEFVELIIIYYLKDVNAT